MQTSYTKEGDEFMYTLQVSSSGKFFVDQDNQPVYWLGDTQWNLFRCHTVQDAELIIDDRIDKGFTCLQVMLLGFSSGVEGVPVCGEAFPDGDSTRPNLKYFEHVDAVVELALNKGMILVVGLDHPTIKLEDRKTAYAYGKWMGQRYAAYPNLIWVPTYSIPEGENLTVMREIVAGLKQSNDGHLLHPILILLTRLQLQALRMMKTGWTSTAFRPFLLST
jgi:hypothetical protein